MMRDCLSGLGLAAITGALYALGVVLGPCQWNVGGGAPDLLLLVGIMVSAVAFFTELLGSRLHRQAQSALKPAP
jgi:ABC-type Fe3+-siderophore transport system permease subunit